MRRLAQLSDANAAEDSRRTQGVREQRKAIAHTAKMFDILTASRLPESGMTQRLTISSRTTNCLSKATTAAPLEALGELTPFHFPIAFPEVFLRDRAGFDVILGNPPWEKARIEELEFWARHSPGLRGLPQGLEMIGSRSDTESTA